MCQVASSTLRLFPYLSQPKESANISFIQIYDTGVLEGPSGSLEVREVQVYGGYVLHIGSMTTPNGKLAVGDKIIAQVWTLVGLQVFSKCSCSLSLKP